MVECISGIKIIGHCYLQKNTHGHMLCMPICFCNNPVYESHLNHNVYLYKLVIEKSQSKSTLMQEVCIIVFCVHKVN